MQMGHPRHEIDVGQTHVSHVHTEHFLAVAQVVGIVVQEVIDMLPDGHEGGGIRPRGELLAQLHRPDDLVIFPFSLPEGGQLLVVKAAFAQKYLLGVRQIGHLLFQILQVQRDGRLRLLRGLGAGHGAGRDLRSGCGRGRSLVSGGDLQRGGKIDLFRIVREGDPRHLHFPVDAHLGIGAAQLQNRRRVGFRVYKVQRFQFRQKLEKLQFRVGGAGDIQLLHRVGISFRAEAQGEGNPLLLTEIPQLFHLLRRLAAHCCHRRQLRQVCKQINFFICNAGNAHHGGVLIVFSAVDGHRIIHRNRRAAGSQRGQLGIVRAFLCFHAFQLGEIVQRSHVLVREGGHVQHVGVLVIGLPLKRNPPENFAVRRFFPQLLIIRRRNVGKAKIQHLGAPVIKRPRHPHMGQQKPNGDPRRQQHDRKHDEKHRIQLFFFLIHLSFLPSFQTLYYYGLYPLISQGIFLPKIRQRSTPARKFLRKALRLPKQAPFGAKNADFLLKTALLCTTMSPQLALANCVKKVTASRAAHVWEGL